MPVLYSLQKMNTRRILLLLLLCCSMTPPAFAPASDSPEWLQVETRYTIIRYESFEDLIKFEQKINYGKEAWGLTRLFEKTQKDVVSDKDKLFIEVAEKVDKLWERVREILDMRRQTPKVTIHIYGSKGQLAEAYYRIYKKENHFRAWYIYEYNTIYISADDLSEGMLAHEMAHSIIDHYLQIRPPAASAEILARYVDTHLSE